MPSEPLPVSTETPALAATTFHLTATNNSSLVGDSYFNVYPPALTSPSVNSQTRQALVSEPTSKGETTTMTWPGGSAALSLFAVHAGANPTTSAHIPVALGDIVAIDWVDGAFSVSPAAGGTAGSIQVTFTAVVPSDTSIGLVVGPGSILVLQPPGQAALTLTPDLSSVATVSFGTPYQLLKPLFSDVNASSLVIFRQGTSSTAPPQRPKSPSI